jgi:glutamate-1-semialdehyde 2,1-aminomutase
VNVLAIVQARMGSSRLPGKVLRPIEGKPLIERLLQRLARAQLVDRVVVATTTDARDDELAFVVRELGYSVKRGSVDDVLERFRETVLDYPDADLIVRITGDCPLIDSEVVDLVIEHAIKSGSPYTSNVIPPTYPDGLDVEVFTREALLSAADKATSTFDREHVTPFIQREAAGLCSNVTNEEDFSHLRWTVDESADLALVRNPS